MKIRWSVGSIVLLLLTAAFVCAQLEENVQVSIMEIWVKVTDRSGQPVTDLKPEEVEILVDGRKAPMRCFEHVGSNDSEDDEIWNGDEPSGNGRQFVLFFDLLNTFPGDLDYLKEPLLDFLRESFHENDRAMVFALLPTYKFGLVQKVTSDPATLVRVIQKMHGNNGLFTETRVNERQLMDLLYPLDTTRNGNPSADKGVGQRPNESYRFARELARNLASEEEKRSRYTLQSFVGIADFLNGRPEAGRTVVLFISSGFPIQPGQHYYDLVQNSLEEQFDVSSPELLLMERPNFDLRNEMRRAMGYLNRLNVTVYSLDAKGLITYDNDASRGGFQSLEGMDMLGQKWQLQDSLVYVAQETGGTVFTGSQDYRRGLASILLDMDQQYWLCTDLPPQKKTGSYHEIEVKVARSGVDVRHRKGYVD